MLVRDHTDYQGLREYALLKDVDYWHAESGNGILHAHEAQYLYTFRLFLTDLEHYDLGKQTHQLLISRFEHASELWLLVTTILDRLEPPTFHYELEGRRLEATSEQGHETFRSAAAH
jgi:hypothetical protein